MHSVQFGRRPRPAATKVSSVAHQSGTVQVSTSTATKGKRTGFYNLLTCLACAQQCNIDFTGITWVDVQGTLGEGGQAVVSQSLANVETVLAFKRRNTRAIGSRFSRGTATRQIAVEDIYREIASEILALGHPSIRGHFNIVQLQAISWELQNVYQWKPGKKLRIWPVLVFEKADDGDLQGFLLRQPDLHLARRVQICCDVASALDAAHRNGIVHGDVKPENVLMFRHDGKVVAKLGDFGFSGFDTNTGINLARTEPWAAPEVYSRPSHSLEQAKLTDIYSFGVLCVWTIFGSQLVGLDSGVAASKGNKSINRAMQALGSYKRSRERAQELYLQIQKLNDRLPDPTFRMRLRRVFDMTLAVDPHRRRWTNDSIEPFQGILDILHGKTVVSTTKEKEARNAVQDTPATSRVHVPAACRFEVTKSLQQLCLTDFRVRQHIVKCLEREYREENLPEHRSLLAIQLAFCSFTGFGGRQEQSSLDKYLADIADLTKQRVSLKHLDDLSKQTASVQQPTSTLLKHLYDSGTIQAIHQAMEFQKTDPLTRDDLGPDRKTEIKAMEKVLGTGHPAVLNLKWTFFRFLLDNSDDFLTPLEFLHDIVKGLEAEKHQGPVVQHATMVTKAYRVRALLGFKQAEVLSMAMKEARSVHSDLRSSGLGGHMASYMVSSALASALEFNGQYIESEQFLELAKAIIAPKLARNHPVSLFIADMEASVQLRQSQDTNEVILKATEMLEDYSRVSDADDPVILFIRGKLAAAYMRQDNYIKALEIINGTERILRDKKKVPLTDPTVAMPIIYTAMRFGNYATAIPLLEAIKADMEKLGDKFRGKRKYHWFYIDARKSVAITDLMKKHRLPLPPRPYPDPARFVIDPELMVMISNLVVCLQAQAHVDKSQRDKLNRDAESHLRSLLQHIDDSFKSVSLVKGKSFSCPVNAAIAKSEMRAAMDEEHTPLVEILTSLGFRNINGGIHYKSAIAASKSKKLNRLAAILEEHQDLCGNINDLDQKGPALFQTRDTLATWIAGHWKGACLYGQLGGRLDPQGVFTLELKALSSTEHPSSVVLTGTCVNGTDGVDGTYTVQGTADELGNIYFGLSEATNTSFKESAKFGGRVNLERQAIGGFYDLQQTHPGVSRWDAEGTFFLYKC